MVDQARRRGRTSLRQVSASFTEKTHALTAGSHGRPVLDGGRELTWHAAAVARLAEQLPILDHHLAAQDHDRRPAVDFPAVPRAVVGAVEVLGAERMPDGGIEHDDVGVAARGEHALRG